jgi:GTPase Era involved in 16S rRNA processing
MLEFIQLLNQRYQIILSQSNNDAYKVKFQQRIEQLNLAESFLRKGKLINSSPTRLLNIALLGPTQAGKSTIANVLLNTNSAVVSPLASFTVQPHGFCYGLTLDSCKGLQQYFGRFQQLRQSEISRDRYDCYTLSEVASITPLLPNCILWDTPDFDSIDSATYREGVFRAAALADILIIVVSKEKYADQSVWDMVAMLEPLKQPTIICLNKLSEGTEELLINSLKEKWIIARTDHFPGIVPLFYQKQTGLPLWPKEQHTLLKELVKETNHCMHALLEQDLIKKYWQEWIEPIHAEHNALRDWIELVNVCVCDAIENYQRDYLNHPNHNDTFQKALAELLNLLEIPGFTNILTGVRKTITWPAKQLMKLGRKKQLPTDNSKELTLLNQLAEHILIQVADNLLDHAEQPYQKHWWKEFSRLLRDQRQSILTDFSYAATTYHSSFQKEVETSAQHLHHKLQEQPFLLNSLRATRVTADAAAIALTLQMGGIGLHDFIFAPAILTINTLLAESALGSYLHKSEHDLKKHQYNTVKQSLFIDCISLKLLALPELLSTTNHFNISSSQLQTAANTLTEKRHGLRLL